MSNNDSPKKKKNIQNHSSKYVVDLDVIAVNETLYIFKNIFRWLLLLVLVKFIIETIWSLKEKFHKDR